MPLSEQEQRILRQIERQLDNERGLGRFTRPPRDLDQAVRNSKRAAAGFVVGLVALSLSFATTWVVGLAGFVVMFASAVVLVQSLRRVAQDRFDRLHSELNQLRQRQAQGRTSGRAGSQGSRWWVARGGRGPDDEDGPPGGR